MRDLPKGWIRTELDEHVSINGRIGWKGLKRSEYTDNGPLFLAVKNILQNGEIDFANTDHISRERYDESPEIKLQIGDILLTKDGTIGKVGMVQSLPAETTVNSSILVIRPKNELLKPRYLFHFLRGPQFQTIAYERITGSAVPHLFQKDLKKLAALVPPRSEQGRIVAKLEKLLGKVDECRTRLEKIPVTLKRFRQSVLAAACSGRLTADWRKMSSTVESGPDLLRRIKEARSIGARNTKERSQITETFESEGLLRSDDDFGFDSIPDTWAACRIGTIGAVVNVSTPSRKQGRLWGGDIPWVSSGEVRNNIITDTRERISKEGYDSCSVRLLPHGTTLLAMIGEGKTRAQSAILDIEATINQNIAAVVISHGLVSSEFLWRWFQYQYEETRLYGSGSGPQALNCQRVRELPFTLPPLAEQQEIVRRVEELFALADRIEGRYKKAKACVDKLTQSILAKAFRGELVPQDPNDEPASELLKKIRKEQKSKKRVKQEVQQKIRKLGRA